MKLKYAPQAGLRRRKPDKHRETLAFWAGILVLVAFELVLMSKSWSPASSDSIFGFHDSAAEAAPDPAN